MITEPTELFWKIFFEVYESLPRQGPGTRTSAARALELCRELPLSPIILDLGCGVGGQTLHLADLTRGTILAVDRHTPSIERLQAVIEKQGLSDRIQAVVGDMSQPRYAQGSFDLIWSEGALYNIGIEQALNLYYDSLRSGGYFAFTDAVWRRENPPADVAESFADYTAMGWARDIVAKIDASRYELIDHFTLPDDDWWGDFYTPMEQRIAVLRDKYAADLEALWVLEQIASEPQMHRNHADYYGYEFFVLRRA